MRVLFVCNQGKHRSRTASDLFSTVLETKSAGLFNEEPVTSRDLTWAELVVVMTDDHRQEIAERFPKQYMAKRILSLGVPDTYNYGHPELKQMLSHRMRELDVIK